MFEHLAQLVILFAVIFDPLASFAVYYAATASLTRREKTRIATYALIVAVTISYTVLILGQNFLDLFNTSIQDFKVASGIILGILGIEMALGRSLTGLGRFKGQSSYGIAAIIGTPLLTGPAAITSIIVTVNDYGHAATALAVAIVLSFTALIFYLSPWMERIITETPIRIISTFLGLITVAWGVKFVRDGLGV